MRSGRSKVVLAIFSLSLCAAPLLAKKKIPTTANPQDGQKRAVHALNRLTFGPRPGDVQQVMSMGVDQWIDRQLHPEKINDDAMRSRLEAFRTLRMNSREIAETFPDGAMIRQVMDGKHPMPSDPAKRAVYEVQIERQEEKQAEKQERKQEVAANNPPAMMPHKTAPQSNAAMVAESPASQLEAAPADAMAMNSSPATNSAPSTKGDAPNARDSTDSSMSMSASVSSPTSTKAAPINDPDAKRREDRLYADLKVQQLIDLPPDQRYKSVLEMNADEKLAFADSLRGGKSQDFVAGMDAKQKEMLLAMNNPQGVVTDELVEAKLLRAIYSDRQLEEVMTDFWFNHFNVYVGKGADRQFVTSYEQDVIRPHAMGKFEDLLVATAKSPAMLFYLDNWLSVGPDSLQGLGIPAHPAQPYRYPPRFPNAKRKQNSGLNENYGRELLELHTLSVNGGYSQHDVIEAAKVFSGWTIDKPNDGGGFKFDPRMHEPGPKFVLGHKIKPRGEDEGRQFLHILATDPRTAHFISLKLAQRFVSDDPPSDLVDRMAKTFLKKKGDIREVLSTLFHSPEFWSDETYRAKVKTPLEFVASAVRATGADVDDALPLTRQLNNMGMPLYGAQPPTGYSMKAETWVSSAALLNRMNFALALTTGKVKGVKVDSVQLAGSSAPPDANVALSSMELSLLSGQVSKQTHDSIVGQIAQGSQSGQNNGKNPNPDPNASTNANSNATMTAASAGVNPSADKKAGGKPPAQPAAPRPPDTGTIAGLLLGSPEFQRR